MTRFLSFYCKLLEALIALFLAVMVVLVFGNVVMRYGFNSGINVSDEVSRWLFIWVTFLGSIVALREHAHLGTDFLLNRLPLRGKKACLAIGYALMLYTCWLLFAGSLAQAKINWDVSAPVTGASVAIFYASGIVFSVSAALILIIDLFKLLTGRSTAGDLIMTRDSEEQS